LRGSGNDDDNDNGGDYSFAWKRRFESRLGKIERRAGSTLEGFYEPRLRSFSVKPGGAVRRLSVTSTCFALLAAMAGNDDTYESLIRFDGGGSDGGSDGGGGGGGGDSTTGATATVAVRPLLERLLFSDWREEDLFQVPLLLYTLLKADPRRKYLGSSGGRGDDETVSYQLRRLTSAVLRARPRRRFGIGEQRYSDYILFMCAQAYSALQRSTARPTTTTSPSSPPPPSAAAAAAVKSSSGTAKKVVVDDEDDGTDAVEDKEDIETKGDTTTDGGSSSGSTGIGGLPSDALPDGAAGDLSLALSRCYEVSLNELCRQLAFRTSGDRTDFDVMRLAYSLLTYVTSTEALAGTAGMELVPGQGPSPGTQVGPPNSKLARAALRAFFEEQLNSGLWDKGQPIYKSFRKQGRNVGNAFVFALDTLSALLEKLPAEEFRPYMPQLSKTLTWIEQQQTVEVIADYCDEESGQCYGKPLRGWASPHLSPDSSPQAWSTAQALNCVSQLRRTVRELMNNDVLNMFEGNPYSEDGTVSRYWDRLLDSDLGTCGSDKPRTLKDVMEERFVEPFKTSVSSPSFGAAYSAILFGPPGTAKTTICESLARRMGWDFVVIDTSVFLADGLTNVAARIKYVFERLQALDRCVILFDEIEEFCLDRETPGIGMESRMLTTAMLTAINDLRRAKRSIFFLATNRLRAFDSAITRPGRFDMQLFVGTPNLEARIIMFRQQLSSIATVDDDTMQEALESYESFLSNKWEETAMFMNYLEGQQFAKACAGIVASGTELTDDTMGSILKAQAAVMTVRGTTRDEFIASMELSRL